MRVRFAVGYWMRTPHLDKTECKKMRSDIHGYIIKNPNFVQLYHKLLLEAEPNRVMGETLLFKASNSKQIELLCLPTSNPSTPSIAEEVATILPLNSWPFQNYASRVVGSTSEGEDFVSLHTIRAISMDDLQRHGGRWLGGDECSSCKKAAPEYFCAYHQIILCQSCARQHCVCETTAKCLWRIDDNDAGCMGSDVYSKDMQSISIFQLLSPHHAGFFVHALPGKWGFYHGGDGLLLCCVVCKCKCWSCVVVGRVGFFC